MGTVPTIATFAASGVVTSAYLNSIKALNDFMLLPPKCSCYQTAVTSIAYSAGLTTGTAMAFDTEIFDVVQSGDTPGHDTATLNSRLFIRTPGKYEVSGQVQFANAAGGNRVGAVRLNAAGSYTGGTLLAQNTQGALSGGSTSCAIAVFEYPFAAGDYIEIFGAQSQTAAVALNSVAGLGNTYLRLKFVGS